MPEVLSTPCSPLLASAPADIVELSVLLSAVQAAELEAVAFQRGATVGEMVRHLVRDFLTVQKTRGSLQSARTRTLALNDY